MCFHHSTSVEFHVQFILLISYLLHYFTSSSYVKVPQSSVLIFETMKTFILPFFVCQLSNNLLTC